MIGNDDIGLGSVPTAGQRPGGGGGAVADGVTIDGNGTLASPLSLIASLYAKLNALPTPASQALADADATIALADAKGNYTLAAGVLTAARTITISNAGAPGVGWSVNIQVKGVQAHDLVIRDHAAGLIHTIVAGQKKIVSTYFTGAIAIIGYFAFIDG